MRIKLRHIFSLFLLLGLLPIVNSAELTVDIEGKKWQPGHYFNFQHKDVAKLDNPNHHAYQAFRNPDFAGVSLVINWVDIETSEGVYDWSVMDTYIDLANEYNKAIILKIDERETWKKDPYIVTEDPVDGRVTPQYINELGCNFQRIRPDRDNENPNGNYVKKGITFAFWLPECNIKYTNMMVAIGKHYEDEPYFHGFFSSETSTSTQGRYGATERAKRQGYYEHMDAIANNLPNQMFIQGMNNWGNDDPDFPDVADASIPALNRIAQNSVERGVGGITGPDLCPAKANTTSSHEIYRNRSHEIAAFPGTQRDGCAASKAAKEALDDQQVPRSKYAIEELKANVILWGEQDYDDDSIAYTTQAIEEYPTITDCPTSFEEGCISPEDFAAALENGGVPVDRFTSCHLFDVGSSVDDRYGKPYVFGSSNELFFKTECKSNEAKIELNVPGRDIIFYNTGYVWKNGAWEEFTLSGPSFANSDQWIRNSASVTIDNIDTSQENYAVTFACEWDGSEWKCGCSDGSCQSPLWNVQAFQK